METRFRNLPSVDRLAAVLRAADPSLAPGIAISAAREAVGTARAAVQAGGDTPSFEAVLADAAQRATMSRIPSLRRVINATGVILQTNLGRAPLSERAIAALDEVARGYSNLEFELEAGERGSRHHHARDLIADLTGAEDALVVNNNAVAVLMALQVFAAGREVIVSRGQAVEIGGGFRIPDIVRQSGARVVEVGTTNRTYAVDYANAAGPETAAILRVHPSNFRVVGFTAEPAIDQLARVADERGVLLLDDLGSGCLVDTTRYGLGREPTVQESIRGGASLVFFSGDKLLGGPQCGIIAGRSALIGQLRRHPLARALRVDKLTIAALIATLSSYREGREADEIPVWRMLALDVTSLRDRAEGWAAASGGEVVEGRSMVGGGSLPGEGVPTWLAALPADVNATTAARALRLSEPPIVARIEHDRVLLDPRTVDPGDDAQVAERLATVVAAR